MPLWSIFRPVPLSNTLQHHPNHRDPLNCGSWQFNVSPLVGHVAAPMGCVEHVEWHVHALGHDPRHIGHQSDDAQTTGTRPSRSFQPCNVSPLVGHVAASIGCAGHAKRRVHTLSHTPTTQHGVLHDRRGSNHLATGLAAIQAAGLVVASRRQCTASRHIATAAACVNHAHRRAHLLGHVT